jgi:hypothetical protein
MKTSKLGLARMLKNRIETILETKILSIKSNADKTGYVVTLNNSDVLTFSTHSINVLCGVLNKKTSLI